MSILRGVAGHARQLDASAIASTVISPMVFRLRRWFLLPVLGAFISTPLSAAVIFKPGEKAKYVAPGEEEISGNAGELFHVAQEAEQKHDLKRALRAYRTLFKKYPKDALAPGSAFKAAQLQEQTKDYLGAAESYRWLMEKYPSDLHFEEAIEGLFRIGEMYLNGKKIKVLGISVANAHDRAVEIFAAIIRTRHSANIRRARNSTLGLPGRRMVRTTQPFRHIKPWSINSLTTRSRLTPNIKSVTSGSPPPKPARKILPPLIRRGQRLKIFSIVFLTSKRGRKRAQTWGYWRRRRHRPHSRSRSFTTSRKRIVPRSSIIMK